ncbi:MAG: hypothetical protein JW863_16875 [Chitinispirillaceae bacterium]|nr:hypothetical protein [Chitinispirillaceae bacterium]
MSTRLRQFLIDTYETRRAGNYPRRIGQGYPIQIDDQDDNDNLNDFCNIFCIVLRRNRFRIDLVGNFPISQQMIDLVDIYNGTIQRGKNRLSLPLSIGQIEAIMDLADRIKKTTFLGEAVNNPNWLPISARTVSSLYRFVRIIKEYNQSDLPPE